MYTDAFLEAIEIVFSHEGTHSNDAADAGGDTWYGIARKDHPGMPWPPSKEQARAVYYSEYWQPSKLDEMPKAIALKLFDLIVNMGARPAIRCLQAALVTCGESVGTDGVMGPATATACSQLPANWLLTELRHEAAKLYRTIEMVHPNNAKFLKGWLNRAYS